MGILILGSPIGTTINNNARAVINVPPGNIWANLAKGFLWGGAWGAGPDPANSNSSGYPTSSPATDWGCNPAMPLGYFGSIVWKWTNIGTMNFIGASMIVSSCPANSIDLLGAATSGAISGNVQFGAYAGNPSPPTSPRIVFQFGWNIQSISQGASNGLGGNYIRINIPTGYFLNGSYAGMQVLISGANVNTGANSATPWTVIPNDAQSFDLAGSVFTNAQAGAAGTAVFPGNNLALKLTAGGTFGSGATQMSNLVVCAGTANETAITNGAITDPVLINQFKYLMNSATRGKPGWLRFMDLSNVQGSYDADFNQRWPANFLYYPGSGGAGARFVAGYYAGSITNTGSGSGFSDVYTCTNPSNSGTGAYVDGEIIQGSRSATNSGVNPALSVTVTGVSRGIKPIIGSSPIIPFKFNFSASPASGGLTMQWTFTAAYLAGLPGVSGTTYTLTYTTSAGATGTVALSGTNQITVSGLTGTLGVGQNLNSVGGDFQNPMVITSIGSTGGGNGVYTVNNTTNLSSTPVAFQVFADTSPVNGLNYNIQQCILGSPTLSSSAASIQVTNSGGISIFPPTAQAGRLSIAYTSGPAICTVVTMNASAIAAGNGTFIYNWLLDAFLDYGSNGILQSVPYEAFVEMCNLTGSHGWFNWPVTRGANVTAVTNFFATNLNSGLKFGTETGNEVWNSGAGVYNQYIGIGSSLGWSVGDGEAILSYAGLRTIQYAALSRAAWASAGRVPSDHYILSMSQVSDFTLANNTPVYQWAGQDLNTSVFPFYASYGQLNGVGTIPTGGSGYNQAGNRPIDVSDAIGYAPYWGSPWWCGQAPPAQGIFGITGTVAVNAPWLQASLDFTNGNFATAYASLVNQFNGTTGRSDGLNANVAIVLGTANTTPSGVLYYTVFNGFESIAAHYDNSVSAGLRYNGLPNLGIMHYEGGPQWGMGADANNGVNSVNSADIAALATQMTNLGWNVSAYTVSGTDNKTECATQVITMAQAWKYDASYKGLIKTSYYGMLASISGVHREVHPAQYGYQANNWGLFPISYSAGNQYTSYDAIHEWDT